MCLIVLAWKASPAVRLAVAANRDEFFARETAPAAWWQDAPDVLAGRDLKAGGTWMGVTRTGPLRGAHELPRCDGVRGEGDAPSRGALVSDFLRGEESAREFLSRIRAASDSFEGFNLLVSDGDELWSFSNVERGARALFVPACRGSRTTSSKPRGRKSSRRGSVSTAPSPTRGTLEELEDRLLHLLRNPSLAPDARAAGNGPAARMGARPLGRLRRPPGLRHACVDRSRHRRRTAPRASRRRASARAARRSEPCARPSASAPGRGVRERDVHGLSPCRRAGCGRARRPRSSASRGRRRGRRSSRPSCPRRPR